MYNFFNPTEIRPHGWLRRQLQIQLSGLGGNLDKVWPDVRESAWVGGDREGWERVPYWLDGFIPMAYYLGDEDAISRAQRYINAILEQQKPDGWICPCSEEEREKYDVWSYFLIGKVLAEYCEFTGSSRAEDALRRAMRCLYEQLKSEKVKLFSWGKYRYYECMIPLQYLYDRKNETWILDFAEMLCEQGEDYDQYKETWKRPLFKWTQYTHIVNLCMRFKQWAVVGNLLGKSFGDEAEAYWQYLEKYNGTAVGTFAGDECLAGRNCNQGTELCAVVELMYSCELLYSITGDPIWADRLEKIAFNALPATFSDDMWSHQYVQMTNQIACIRFPGKSIFRTNGREAHLFGLEPEFGCCTANHLQGWPKLVSSIFMRCDDGIRVTSMLPSEISTDINGVAVRVQIETEYPFKLCGKLTVQTANRVDFALRIRIPAWAKTCIVNQQLYTGSEVVIQRTWEGCETVEIEFCDTPHLVKRPQNLCAVEYGPLVFSLPIETEYKMYEYERKEVERKFPYCDYELYPKSEWRYGFASDGFTVYEADGNEIPFGSQAPRVMLKTKLCRVDWGYADGFDSVCAAAPNSEEASGKIEEKMLIPYGCAKLRMTEMPLVTFEQGERK